MFIGKECSWITQNSSAPCKDSNSNLYFSDSVSRSFFVLSSVNEKSKLRPSDFQTAAHELFHSVQGKLGGGNWPSRVPSWFIEGGANFIGISFSDLAGISTYSDGRYEEVFLRDYQNKPHNPLSNYTYDNFLPNVNYLNPYGIGAVATEYIVASVGLLKYLDIYRNLGRGQTFSVSFEMASGISLEDFYTKFEIIRDQVGFPHGL